MQYAVSAVKVLYNVNSEGNTIVKLTLLQKVDIHFGLTDI